MPYLRGNFEKLDIAISTVHYNFEKFKTKVFENPPTPELLQLYNVWNFPNRDTRYGLEENPIFE
jgi:hypothetical protein